MNIILWWLAQAKSKTATWVTIKNSKKEQNQITPQAGLEPSAADYTTGPKPRFCRAARKKYHNLNDRQREVPT
jgi:hypothetical protein